MLKFFQKDINRDIVCALVEGYQLNMIPVVDKAKKLYTNTDELPSWAKFVENPVKGRGFYNTLLEGMFKGKHNLSGVDVELLVQSTKSNLSERRIAMIFFPDNTKVDNLIKIGNITQSILNSWSIIVLNGKTVVGGGGDCERVVNELINSTTNNILIISAKMAQRSFSEESISELYLAYDKGQDGATIQKMSRALTSKSPDKIARIFSLSFDPNRDDKLDTIVFQAAFNQVEKKVIMQFDTKINEAIVQINQHFHEERKDMFDQFRKIVKDNSEENSNTQKKIINNVDKTLKDFLRS
jgi:hypothetical protein